MRMHPFVLALAATFVARDVQADVLVVDASGGGDHATIQAAVDAAADGDLVLVRAGTYGGFTIDDKALTVVGDPDGPLGSVAVNGLNVVRDLASDRTVVLGLMRLSGTAPAGAERPGLLVDGCAGPVRVQACLLWGADGTGSTSTTGDDGAPGARVSGSSDVAFLGCQLEGGIGQIMGCSWGVEVGGRGGSGLQVETSTVWLYDGVARGGRGNEGCKDGGDGGHGARVVDGGVLFASNATLVAGDGDASVEFLCDPDDPSDFYSGGDGGDGMRLAAGTLARTLDCALVPGLGSDVFFCGVPGVDGVAVGGAGTHLPLAGTARAMNMAKVVPEGGTLGMQLVGQPGETALLLLALETGAVFKPAWQGVFMLGAFAGPYTLGVVPANGAITLLVPLPELPAGVLGVGLFAQSAFLAPGGGVALGSPAHVTWLDASF